VPLARKHPAAALRKGPSYYEAQSSTP